MSHILDQVENYYSECLRIHGVNSKGVDWRDRSSQLRRFEVLCSLLQAEGKFTVGDLGCGYGELYRYLRERYPEFHYYGFDVSSAMISAAKSIIAADNAEFHCAGEFSRQVDYGMASGVFNVKLENSDDDWLKYILDVLDGINEKSALGFAVNFLSTYSDPDKRKSKLFYANPLRMFDCFRRRYSRNLSLMHDYGLYEFSIVVRKNK